MNRRPIVAIGTEFDKTLCHLVRHARQHNVVQVIDLSHAVTGNWRFDTSNGGSALFQDVEGRFEIAPDAPIYCRILDLSDFESDAAVAARWHPLVTGLCAWLEGAEGPVVNLPGRAEHNGSKPLHEAYLQDFGFDVPESITTSDRNEAIHFVRQGLTISKAVCGARTDAVLVSERDFDEFEPSSGPVYLQRFIRGADARIHVTADRLVAQQTSVDAPDYRLAGGLEKMTRFEPPGPVRDRLIEATRELDLVFGGWDFRIDGDGSYWCLEANPMPAYHPYDLLCEGAISADLLRVLGPGRSDP